MAQSDRIPAFLISGDEQESLCLLSDSDSDPPPPVTDTPRGIFLADGEPARCHAG
jgi:hypothetical protein